MLVGRVFSCALRTWNRQGQLKVNLLFIVVAMWFPVFVNLCIGDNVYAIHRFSLFLNRVVFELKNETGRAGRKNDLPGDGSSG